MRILTLITEAFGGKGGIALYNRDLLTALCAHPDCSEVVAIPRFIPRACEPLPEKLSFIMNSSNSKMRYLKCIFQIIKKNPKFDLIICGHIHLIPFAYIAKLWLKKPVLLETYGIDAWKPTQRWLVDHLVHKVDAFVSISDITRTRFLGWVNIKNSRGFVLPNAIHIDLYGPGARTPELIKRYGLENKTVLMTLGRLAAAEKYKGFDEVMELLPELSEKIPEIVYMIVGDGSDRQRLEKAKDLGVKDRVIFTGSIPETEKEGHYRLADAYVMPSHGEGFGFVFLEAMACGIPVVASKTDGGREAVRNGELGILVDPAKPDEIKEGILEALNKPKEIVPQGIEYFSFDNFVKRSHKVIDQTCSYNVT